MAKRRTFPPKKVSDGVWRHFYTSANGELRYLYQWSVRPDLWDPKIWSGGSMRTVTVHLDWALGMDVAGCSADAPTALSYVLEARKHGLDAPGAAEAAMLQRSK